MNSNASKPSKWWFWAFPLAGLCYFAAGFAIGLLLGSSEPVPGWLQPLALIVWPLDYFDEHVFGAVCDVLGRPENGLANLLAFLALWVGCWALLGLFAYRVVRGRLVKAEALAVAPEKARRPSRWWFWGPTIAVNAWVLLPRLVAGPYRGHGIGAPAWFGVLVLEVVALVVGLAFYGAAAIDARRSNRKRGDGSQE